MGAIANFHGRNADDSVFSNVALAVAIALLVASLFETGAAAEDLSVQRQTLNSQYLDRLHALAKSCEAESLARQAEFTKTWLPKRDAMVDYSFVLPASSAAPRALVDSTAAQSWWERFGELRHAQADKLIALADAALKAKEPALAFELVREAVRENPDHERGRNILGYQREQDRWVTAETARRMRAGQVWSEKFGWLAADQLPRYERGMRYYRGRWIEAAEDARLHSNIRNGWRIETDHYAVVTNYSLVEGVQLAQRLEKLFDVWQQLFVTYYASGAEIERCFAGRTETPTAPASRKLFEVVYFRNRQEYVDFLQASEPQIGMSLGFYSDRAKAGYFFAGDEQYDGTVYHEATHQLFREMKPGAIDPGRKNSFWIVEGIACYMESLTEHRLMPDEAYGSYITVGGENAGRLPAARKRLLDDNFYVPLRDLVSLGMNALQHEPRLPMIYSQSTGLTLFLMHADGARYRLALMDYLTAIYTGHANFDTLEKLTGQRYEELDRQYRTFMK